MVAADVIYSDNLTEQFFSTVKGLLDAGMAKEVVVAIEKRVF